MTQPLLLVENLTVGVEGKNILHNVNLTINEGEVHILFGPNGSGKSTLMNCLMGLPGYRIQSGRILFKSQDITQLPIEARAQLGIGLSFQHPPAVRGVSLRKLITGSMHQDSQKLSQMAEELNLLNHLDRDINKSFSGGEIKRSELLQLMVQSPDFLMLDEPESGVDLENIELISHEIAKLLGRGEVHALRKASKSAFIISHTGYILNHLTADKGHVLIDGQILCDANPIDILKMVKKHGYKECFACLKEAKEENISIRELIHKRYQEEGIHP